MTTRLHGPQIARSGGFQSSFIPSNKSHLASMCSVLTTIFLLLPGVLSSPWQWNSDNTVPRKVKPMVTRPSGPTNVKLYVVSRTELGVAWEPPLFDGGAAITKYLVEWDTDRYFESGIASPSNPYDNSVDGPLVRSEVVWGETKFQISGLLEGQKYYVRVSAFGDGYSNAISTSPAYAIPAGMLPGYPTEVELSVASHSATADRLYLAWSAPKLDINEFGALPSGCAGGGYDPDPITGYRVRWDTHPSFSNANVYDVPAFSGDGSPKQCCPTGSEGACNIELGAEVQTLQIKYPSSTVSSGAALFDTGAVRVVYVGSQSKSIRVETPLQGSTEVRIAPTPDLPSNSPISAGDIIRIQSNVYLVSDADGWPNFVSLATAYEADLDSSDDDGDTINAYFTSPPSSCFDVSSSGNSADNFRAHISQSFDDSPFDESITVSRTTLKEPYESGDPTETRVVGYEYHVTFAGQGFSSTLGSPVEELMVISEPASPFSAVGSCSTPFVSDGLDVSSKVTLQISTDMDSNSFIPGESYYVQIAGINAQGIGPYVSTNPEVEVPRSQPGLAQNCQIFAIPTLSTSLKVEWDGVNPNHGEAPTGYKIEFYDVDSNLLDPAVTTVVDQIDESSRYSIIEDNLMPGSRYKVLIIPLNGQGEGAPNWFSSFNPIGSINDFRFSTPENYFERSCHAVPTCESGTVECHEFESDDFIITSRSAPLPPLFDVGTYPTVSSRNRFSETSLLVTFESPMTNNIGSIGIPTDKFLVEWSTSSSFLPNFDGQGYESLWSSEVVAFYSDDSGENSFGELLIDSLEMGKPYFVRVSAHNSAGYGNSSISVPCKPMTRPDPPFEPMLSGLTLDHLTSLHPASSLSENALMGTSLLVSWQPPKIDSNNGRPDTVGDGGDSVSSYLVEWSRVSWDNYIPTEFEISVSTASGIGGSSAAGILSGSFQISVDTSQSVNNAVSGSYTSASIPIDSTSTLLKTILENMPNVGEVAVESVGPLAWHVTFLSEVGAIELALAKNSVVGDNNVAGIVDLTKTATGSVPYNAAYGFHIIDDLNSLPSEEPLRYAIQHLVPGMKVFVRMSAGNSVGFGPRRKTAPEFLSPSLQRPDYPTSLYTEDTPPFLSVHSPTALKVHIGPPSYDGGSPLTFFYIEWDTSPNFDTSKLGDGSALGSSRTSAASRVCDSCVTDFDLATNTFTYTGSEVTTKLLSPQRKMMIFFNDDNKSYIFSVLSASSNEIVVASNHLRMLSLENMQGQVGQAGSNLNLLGTTFIIDGLETGRAYFVRVSSENGEMGTGKHIGTVPEKESPRGLPLPLKSASVSVKDKNTLKVTWSKETNLDKIQAFKLEHFMRSDATSATSQSFFGEQEVVEFASTGLGLVGGSFTLYFGGFDSSTHVFCGIAKVTNGFDYIETQEDLTPHLHRGQEILIGDHTYFVHDSHSFTSERLPLSETYSGENDSSVSIFAKSKSMPISFDASAEEVKNALEQMPFVNSVDVRREVDDNYPDGYQWFVTFTSNVGPQPSFTVDSSLLIGTNPMGFTISKRIIGVLPDSYERIAIQDPSTTSFELTNLATGKPYYIRVAAVSDKGESLSLSAFPSPLAPGGVPGVILPPSIRPLNENTLVVRFEDAEEENGAVVEEYVIDFSTDSSFASSSRKSMTPNNRIQRITTRAHSLPWSDSSSFTLSLGDFHGDFTVPIGYGTTVRIDNGGSILERSSGDTALSSAVARGDYLSVGGSEFRVCLDLSEPYPYDETHLTLCTKDDAFTRANFVIDSPLDVIDELPVFILDTSLGAAKSPTVGDIFLSSIDAKGLSKDTRSRLRRGDLVRVGHPDMGETYRISTDLSRGFTDTVIPLSSIDDSSKPASLSSKSLKFSTYEVQSFSIRSISESDVLTPSSILSSGFRIRFKSETTHKLTGGGAKGCLKWDGDANTLKAELEFLSTIDAVEVSRSASAAIPGGLGAGVEYRVTFTGLNVRGNVSPLEIVDVGTNGCLDANTLGGTFSDIIAPISVQQVEIAYVPFYEVQTSRDIPYSAEAADVKAAVESLSQSCKVEVSREINRNGFSWYITFTEDSGDSSSPLLIAANGENLLANIDPGVSVRNIQETQLSTSVSGAPYFVRVAAMNSFGMGPFTISNPRAIEVSPQPPSAPVDVFAEAISHEEILVQWNPPTDDGGRHVTYYKVEYDELLSFTGGQNGGSFGSISVSSSSINSISDVQSVTVMIDSDGLIGLKYLSGTFSLSFDGQKTDQLPYNASPEEMKEALEDLCNLDEVLVSRSIHCSPDKHVGCMEPEGFTWLVTFVSVENRGDQHHKPTSKLWSSVSHKLSVDGSYLFECEDVARSSCSIGGSATASVATVQELQRITVASSPFSVNIGGETSEIINIGDSIAVVEGKLNSFSKNGVGKIEVTCAECTDDVVTSGVSILLHFLTYRGDLPAVSVSDSEVIVSEVVKGTSQFVIGRSSYSTTIPNLTSVKDWHVRVFAYNSVGEGIPAVAWPSPLRLAEVAPQVPMDVVADVESARSLAVSWDRPSSIGGVQLTSFKIEYDTSPTFTSQNGMPLGQLTATESDTDTSIGIVAQAYPGSIDPIFRKRIVVEDANLINEEIIVVGSKLVIEKQNFIVLSINKEGCGVTCLTVDKEYSGSNASGMKIYSGLDPKQYSYTITGLIPGVPYFTRVAAMNEKALGPFAYVGHPFTPTSLIPMDVPPAISWATLTPVSKDQLQIDFGLPLFEKPEGFNGTPLLKYHIEVSTGAFEVQELQVISSTPNLPSGAFSLTFDGENTECINIGASSELFAQALENLSAVDGVSVEITSQSTSHITYTIQFNGPSLDNKDLPQLEIDSLSSCTQSLEGAVEFKFRTVQEGVEKFRPEIVELFTHADTEVDGYFEVSVGYQGEYSNIVSLGNQPAYFKVEAGSRSVSTMGNDLRSILYTGDSIVIAGETTTITAVSEDQVMLEEYHRIGTRGAAVFGYRMDNFIGRATIAPGDNSLTEANGHNLESILRPQEVIEIVDDARNKIYLTVISVAGSSINFSPSYAGDLVTTPIHAKKRVIVSAKSSAAAMKKAIESLPDVGLVDVSREGPNIYEGYSWYITFLSNSGMSPCSSQSWCFSSRIDSLNYIVVNGLGQQYDGNYILTSFAEGRTKYVLLERSCYISYNSESMMWELVSSTDDVVSSVTSSDVSVPLSGWTNGALIALSAGNISLLTGKNAAAEISVLQSEVGQSFNNIKFSEDILPGQPEVQELELLCDENDIQGYFELSLGNDPDKVVVYSDDSVEDLKTKIESLAGVGRVKIDSTDLPGGKFGQVWAITFLSNAGDAPLFQHHGTSGLQGTNVSLNINEKVKGISIPRRVLLSELESGRPYSARIRAENQAGAGPFTTTVQKSGSGVYPMARSASSPPGQPVLRSGVVTKSQAMIEFSESLSNGSEISSYKFEWTTADTFGTPPLADVSMSCSDGSALLGAYKLVYGSENVLKSQETNPLDIRSSQEEISLALNALTLLNEVEVSYITNEESELKFIVTFLHHIGPVGTLTIYSNDLRCQSEEPMVESSVLLTNLGSMPDSYGSKEIFTNDDLCGSCNLGEFSPTQYLSLYAGSGVVTGGSFKLKFDGKSSECISFDASESQVKSAILSFDNVEEANVIASNSQHGSSFPFSYTIEFKGNYAYGDWPALQIDTAHFGAGSCDPFIGGVDHKAVILPIRDESICSNGVPQTISIVVDSLSTPGGTFVVRYGAKSSGEISIDASAKDMSEILEQLIGTSVEVSKHQHDDMNAGVAWAVTYPRSKTQNDQISTIDAFVTGKNAKVNVYPILSISSFSPQKDSRGDFRIVIDGESTAPLSHQATQKKILQELHRINGIGKVTMLGPAEMEDLSSLELNALVDDSLVIQGHKAIAMVGDLTSSIANGDSLTVGTCDTLEIKSIAYEEFDSAKDAGQIYETRYSGSSETANAKNEGISILLVESENVALSFSSDCFQVDGVSETILVGSILRTSYGTDHSVIIKSYTANLDSVNVTPERNWRGTAPRFFLKPPGGSVSNTFLLDGLDKGKKYSVRAFARNAEGYGPPSNILELLPASTVPSAPTSVSLM